MHKKKNKKKYDAMKNFMRNFVVLQLFAENAKG